MADGVGGEGSREGEVVEEFVIFQTYNAVRLQSSTGVSISLVRTLRVSYPHVCGLFVCSVLT